MAKRIIGKRVKTIGDHPHSGESGVMIGFENTIAGPGLRVELDSCPHGTAACFVFKRKCIGGRPVKAITIWQPWASLVAVGAKTMETRSWPTKYRGPIAIHAAQRPFNTDIYLDRELHIFTEALCLPDIYSFDSLPYGCVIATAELVECWKITNNGHTNGSSLAARIEGGRYGGKTNIVEGKEIFFGDWTPGRYAWEFTNMCMLPEPIPAKGKQGLWNWELPEVAGNG